uniref:Uncharacterized protein n=1 Tax=Panagrolaimus superbus TaxID=310955 RepID=A0A914Y7C5_9BILA
MPSLNKDILLEILESIVQNNLNESNKLQMEMYKFSLIGKENLSILMEFLEKATECNIDKDCYIAKIRQNTLLISPSSLYLLSMMKKIGQNIESLTIQGEPDNTKPIIDAICEVKKLKELDLEDSLGIFAFHRVIKECSTSLKKITACVNADIPEIGAVDGLHLDELLIETDLNNNFNTFLNENSCKTNSLSFDLYQFLPTSSFNWDHLIHSFSGVKNPVLNHVKEFKLLLEIDEYAEAIQLTEFIKNIAETFPNIELFHFEKNIPTQLYYGTNPLKYYNAWYDQFTATTHHFKTKILWNISQKCQSLEVTKQNILSQTPKFKVIKEDDRQITLLCCEQLSNLKDLTFQIHLTSTSSSSRTNENSILAEMNSFNGVDI